jgi:hypothetical protein
MTTGELIASLAAAQENSAWWQELAREAHSRARWGSLHPHHVPAGYDPVPAWLFTELDLEDAEAS